MSEILAFGTYVTCPKCKSERIVTSYHERYRCAYLNCDERHDISGCKEPKEHLHRRCAACRYEWLEAPADVPILEEAAHVAL